MSESRQRRFHLASRLGGPQPHGGPLLRPGRPPTVPPGAAPVGPRGLPGGSGAVIRPPAPTAVRSSGTPPHSSQSSSPGSSSAPPAATSSRIRPPSGPPVPSRPRRSAAARPRPRRPAAPVRRSGARSAARPVVPPPWPSPARARTSRRCRLRRQRRAGERDGESHARTNSPPGFGYAVSITPRSMCSRWGRTEAFGSARVFARSGANGGAPHGLSVLTGKTFLVGRGDTRSRTSHVRHRRTDSGGICLACGNIVSHHQVGAGVGCS